MNIRGSFADNPLEVPARAPKTRWLAIPLAMTAACQPASERAVAIESGQEIDPCEVAVAFVDDWRRRTKIDRPFVVSSKVERTDRLSNKQLPRVVREMRRDPPSIRLMKELNDQQSPPVLARCPALTRHLDELGVQYGPEALAGALRQRPDGSYAMPILSLTFPVVERDSAMLAADSIFAPEGGGGALYHLRRDAKGKWIVADWVATWIS